MTGLRAGLMEIRIIFAEVDCKKYEQSKKSPVLSLE
jgi:hypothetical protein